MPEFCCDAFKSIVEKYELPLEQPVTLNMETMEMQSGRWAMRLFKKTKSGNVSKKDKAVVYLNYCLLCGTELQEAE